MLETKLVRALEPQLIFRLTIEQIKPQTIVAVVYWEGKMENGVATYQTKLLMWPMVICTPM
jgi:hypothetical protein